MPIRIYLTAAFYKFVELADFEDRKEPLLAFCRQHGVKGTILLARPVGYTTPQYPLHSTGKEAM